VNIEEVATVIVDSAIKVHRALGPGLLESVYQLCITHELRKRGLKVETEVILAVEYDGLHLDVGYRIDMLIEDLIIVENKAVEKLTAVHEAQLPTYLKLRKSKLGFLLNWNEALMKHGIRRMVNQL